jgi:hypothetical protein
MRESSAPNQHCSTKTRRALLPIFVLVGAISVVGSTLVRAEDTGSVHPINSVLEMLDLKTKVGAAPDFVEASRPKDGKTDYLSVGAKRPQRALKVKSAAEVKAAEAELDAARDAQVAGRRPAPQTATSVPKSKAGKPLKIAPNLATQN